MAIGPKGVEKGLSLMKEIGVISKYEYHVTHQTYSIFGNHPPGSGLNHKIYLTKELTEMSASELHAQMILDFGMEEGKGFFYRVKRKLQDLSNRIIEYDADEDGWQDLGPVVNEDYKREQYEVYQLLQKLMEDGKISRKEMRRCNELWKKYKKN